MLWNHLIFVQSELLQEEFEDTKGVIRIRMSKKNRQHNDQKNKHRSTKHTHKAKGRATRTPLNLVTNSVISHE
jgi:hypothetical protein